MKTFDREKEEYAKLVKAGKFSSKECAQKRNVCKALEIIHDLQLNMEYNPNRFCAELKRKDIFEKLMNFD